MPRKPRLFLPGVPQHVVVRGHNRDPIFARHGDFRFFYRCLLDALARHPVKIHAWVLMHNHIHLLLTPDNEVALPGMMQSLGRRYAQYFNKTYHRSGSLWEGRYKSAFVDSNHYLLRCYCYTEMNPVRAGMVKKTEDYPYSSFHANALGREDRLVTPHAVYLDLLKGSESARPTSTPGLQNYRDLFKESLTHKELTDIRRGTQKGLGIGLADFLLRVARLQAGDSPA